MKSYRIFVSKKKNFNIEEIELLDIIKTQLNIKDINNLKIYNIYDIFNTDEYSFEILKNEILSNEITDNVYEQIELKNSFIAYEYLPGQFDLRASAAEECLQILNTNKEIKISTGSLVLFESIINDLDLNKIKNHIINLVDSREKNLNILSNEIDIQKAELFLYKGFNKYSKTELELFLTQNNLAMSIDDLIYVKNYFNNENRNPTDTEIMVLDTYWSDHCRHTTFETILEEIKFKKSPILQNIKDSFKKYQALRLNVHNDTKPITLMDMATIVAKYKRKNGSLQNVEISEEINACSVEVNIINDDQIIPCILQFKNETHNHPTEIEPFGGASTCIGGAIRDPLSGRSYVYQALRISGAANINERIEHTIENKLPQSVISKKAASGFSSYGNQIGLATTFVKEIFHEGYKAKRMEVGMVVGVVPKNWVRREKPEAGDLVILVGGKTGRDGIGGATGSSKEYKEISLTKSAAEVQKGNATIERKLQRFFKNKSVCKLIKKANDFGAGGVCVAVGELADGLKIELDKIPLKYKGLNATEIAISESQERMAVVIENKDWNTFKLLAENENLESTIIATVTNSNRLIMTFEDKEVLNLSREFINSAGIKLKQNITVESDLDTNKILEKNNNINLNEHEILNHLQKPNIASLQGMSEYFDSTIGSTTILFPYGGKYKNTETEASVQLIPIEKNNSICSVVSFGFDPYISSFDPYLGGAYAVITSLAKLVATGSTYKNAYLSFQEYFKKLNKDEKNWSEPFLSLLGTIEAQMQFNVAAIGGKDSMSGTFKDIHVPPTLISFAVQTSNVENIISPEFKNEKNYIYIVYHKNEKNYLPNYNTLIKNFDEIEKGIKEKKIISCITIKSGGIAEAILKMSFGNKISCNIKTDLNLIDYQLGSFIIEANVKIENENFIFLGNTCLNENIKINDIKINIQDAINSWQSTFNKLYPLYLETENKLNIKTLKPKLNFNKTEFNINKTIPKVLIPVFSGTNCEYDTAQAFEKEGANIEYFVFNNLSNKHIEESINQLSEKIKNCQILALPGGFSAGDEPDGSGKFIANVLKNNYVNNAIQILLKKGGLIIGICNGFQALIKSGLLPFNEKKPLNIDLPILYKNDINRHISTIISTKIITNNSPWLSKFSIGEIHKIPISHGEGKIVCNDETYNYLNENNQIATQYVDEKGIATMNPKYNLNGSYYAIEGLLSPCGQIFGKMGHSERYKDILYKNIPDIKYQNIFYNAIKHFI